MSIYHREIKLIKKDTILEVFGYLKSKQIVSGESEFSEHWLGCSEGYMRKLRHKKTEPSLGTIAICASRLQNAAEQLQVLPRYQPLAQQLTSMSVKCRSLVDAESVEFELTAWVFCFRKAEQKTEPTNCALSVFPTISEGVLCKTLCVMPSYC